MGESKQKKQRADEVEAELDRKAAEIVDKTPPETVIAFFEGLIGHCERNQAAMAGRDAATQGRFVRHLFEKSVLVVGLWQVDDEYEAAVLKGDDKDVVAHLSGGLDLSRVSALFIEDEEHAEAISSLYSILPKFSAKVMPMALDMFDMQMPAARPMLKAHIAGMEAQGLL